MTIRLALARLVWLVALACCFSAPAVAAPSEAQLEIAELRDAGSMDSIVSSASLPAESYEVLPNGPRGGYSAQARWFRLSLSAPAGEWWLSILPVYLDDLRLFVPDAEHPGAFTERRAGDLLPFSAREEAYRGFVFKLRKPQTAPMVLYLRLQSKGSLHLSVNVRSPQEFRTAMALEYGLLMGIAGAGLILFLLSLNTSFWLRDKLAMWLAAYLASLVFTYAVQDGFVTQYLLGQYPAVDDLMIHVFALLTVSVGSAFYRRLFQLEPQQRLFFGFYRVLTWMFLPGVLLMLAGLTREVMVAVNVLMLLLFPLSLWLSWQLWRRGSVGAGLMLASNLVSALAALATYLVFAGVLPVQLVPSHVVQIAGLATAVAFFLVVGQRFRAAQELTFQAQQERTAEHEKMRQQTEFFAMLSHELKTPLAMIDGSVQSLELLNQSTPEVARRYERIRRAVTRINDLIQKFLTYSRLDRRNPPLRPRELQLDVLVRDTVAGFAAREGRFVLDLETGITLKADDGLLKVLISNLLDNALKYSPPATTVWVVLRRAAGLARLQVQDQGRGVPADLRERLFESYVRGEQVGDVPGAGLGLHLVRKIARLHGGDVKLLDSGSAKTLSGALFEVTLPVTVK